MNLTGEAGHAGTVPMMLRRDALAGAAEMHAAHRDFLRATPRASWSAPSGASTATPGATNVIPGSVLFTFDMRAPTGAHARGGGGCRRGVARDRQRARLYAHIDVAHEIATAPCAPAQDQLADAIAATGHRRPAAGRAQAMTAGDGAALPVGMLFVRCRGGISHNPAEHVEAADADAGARVLLRLIENFRPRDTTG